MKLHRRTRRLELDQDEAHLLQLLLDELRPVVADEDADDPVRQRLYPSAYPDDGDAEAEYRSLTESTLRDERVERIDACAGELAAGPIDLRDPDVARRWLQVLNDLRLTLGTRLGVTEEPPSVVDPADPDAQAWALYGWLTALQDSMVHAVMR